MKSRRNRAVAFTIGIGPRVWQSVMPSLRRTRTNLLPIGLRRAIARSERASNGDAARLTRGRLLELCDKRPPCLVGMGEPAGTTGCSWRLCCGSRAPGAHGGILQRISATGVRPSGGSATGGKLMFSRDYSMHYRMSQTWITSWWMPRSSRFTVTDRAQRGTQSEAIGRSKGGMTTKILTLTDALGNLVRFHRVTWNRNPCHWVRFIWELSNGRSAGGRCDVNC